MNKILLSCLLLTGCSSFVSQQQYERAVQLCSSNQGLNTIEVSHGSKYFTVYCNNNARFTSQSIS